MADLTHRADCHASGTAAQYAAAVKGDLEPVFLCAHHTHTLTDALERQGWTLIHLNDNEKVPA